MRYFFTRILPASVCLLVFGPNYSLGSYVSCGGGGYAAAASNYTSCSTGNTFASIFSTFTDETHFTLEATASVTQNQDFSGYAAAVFDARGELSITFYGGTGPGYFTPCMGGYSDRRYGYVSGHFGPLTVPSPGPFGGLCGLSNFPGYQIPFVFGIPETYSFDLAASVGVYGAGSGTAYAQFNGFIVRDGSGNIVPDATWLVPEPCMTWPLLAAGSALLFMRRVRQKRQ